MEDDYISRSVALRSIHLETRTLRSLQTQSDDGRPPLYSFYCVPTACHIIEQQYSIFKIISGLLHKLNLYMRTKEEKTLTSTKGEHKRIRRY